MSEAIPWKPVLVDEMADRAAATVDELVGILARPDVMQSCGPSLGSGQAGLALLFSYLGREDAAAEALGLALDAAEARPLSAGLYGGFPGIAFSVAQLSHLFDGSGDPNAAVDDALLAHLGEFRDGEYDLIRGVTGIGVYALERMSALGRGSEVVEAVIRALQQVSVDLPNGCSFVTRPEWSRPELPSNKLGIHYDLGVAHGVPGVISFLAMSAKQGVLGSAEGLLTGAVEWMLGQRFPADERAATGASFPYATSASSERIEKPARSAWCYGDPGAAICLIMAGRAMGISAWEAAGLEAARLATSRSVQDSGVLDAGICHGAAGLGHLFNRLWQATDEDVFLQAARRWFARALEMRSSRGLGGYETWYADGARGEPGYLMGVCGIAMALAAATSTKMPEWDRPLLTAIERS